MEKKLSNKMTYSLSTKKIALLGILCALSLIMFILENLLPPLFLPGAKIGLSNIFTLVTLILFSPIEAIILVLVRTTLGSIIVGNLSALMYSIPAGVISIIISSVLLKFVHPRISILSISVVGAICHNIIQNTIFCFVSQTYEMFAYTPYFALIGVLSGVVVGFIVFTIIHKIPQSIFDKLYTIKSCNNNN